MVRLYGPDSLPLRGPENEAMAGNWSGYAVTAGNYTSAQGTWIVPGVSYAAYAGSPSVEVSSTWVGIGGDSDQTLIQLGTQQQISSSENAVPVYAAWYELVCPTCSPTETFLGSDYPVFAGDVITASLRCAQPCVANFGQTWTLLMQNTTQGWTWTSPQPISFISTLASAEWIMEASTNPATGSIFPLPYFAPPPFSNLTVSTPTANNVNPQLSLPANGIIMNDIASGGTFQGAATPTYADGGNSFTVNYLAAPCTSNVSECFTEFPILTPGSSPYDITTGPDGALWFAESSANKIGRITTAGVITEFPIPTAGSFPDDIRTGPDGALWFTEFFGKNIGRIPVTATVANPQITEFPTPTATSDPDGITAGPDGALWFVENDANKIGRITTAGVFTEFPIPTAGSNARKIATGADGALWFTEQTPGNKIGRIPTTATVANPQITEFPIPTANSGPYGITTGPDGALWFAEEGTSKIGRIATAGAITEFPILGSNAAYIVAGPDGALWFTNGAGNKIGRFTTGGTFTEFPVPTAQSYPWGITTGPDGALWFTESGTNKIGRLVPPSASGPLTAAPTSGQAPLAVSFMATGLAPPMTYTINFGDGMTGALSQSQCIGILAIPGGQGGIQCSGPASHTYTTTGTYTATLWNASGLRLDTVTITTAGAAPNVGIAPPNKATILGSRTISAMQDVPRQTLEVPFAGSNATVPTISSFTASPASISPFDGGGSATLSWSVASATSLSISGLGAVIGNSIQISPSQTTTYTLTASNAQGAVTAQTTVAVAGYRWRRVDPQSP